MGGNNYVLITGVDIIEIERVKIIAKKYGDRFLKRIYTPSERKYCRGRAPQLASRFAAKEATMKALGTGVRGVGWKDIEIKREKGKAPYIQLHGRALNRAKTIELSELALSLSHSKDFAVASVVGTSVKGNILPRN
tara:strand:- start:79 stop:486 length:408 start_codon:yes stop_codon:yes gene_type:complete